MRAKCRTHERRKPMNDKMTPDKERENCPCRKAIINPFDAMMMVVVRRLDKAYLELKRSKPPAKEAEFALRNAKLSFYGELVRQSIETVFSPKKSLLCMKTTTLREVLGLFGMTSAALLIRYSLSLQSSVSTNRYRKRLPIC